MPYGVGIGKWERTTTQNLSGKVPRQQKLEDCFCRSEKKAKDGIIHGGCVDLWLQQCMFVGNCCVTADQLRILFGQNPTCLSQEKTCCVGTCAHWHFSIAGSTRLAWTCWARASELWQPSPSTNSPKANSTKPCPHYAKMDIRPEFHAENRSYTYTFTAVQTPTTWVGRGTSWVHGKFCETEPASSMRMDCCTRGSYPGNQEYKESRRLGWNQSL